MNKEEMGIAAWKESKQEGFKEQLKELPDGVILVVPFNEEREDSSLNLETLFSVDVDALNRVFSFDASKLQIDTSAFSDMDMSIRRRSLRI